MQWWSKVDNTYNKPIKWWYHKVLCELGYFIEKKINGLCGIKMYYHHLNKLCDYGYNLYGKKINNDLRRNDNKSNSFRNVSAKNSTCNLQEGATSKKN